MKTKLVYLWSLRNAAADKAGQQIAYKGKTRYMKSVLEYLVEALNDTPLGKEYSLEGIIFDDDNGYSLDCEKLKDYGFSYSAERNWFFPPDLYVQGHCTADLLHSIPSTYRSLPKNAPERAAGKSDFEKRLHDKLVELDAELVIVDGLLVILDELVRQGSRYFRKILNIHPGITRLESAYERRGAYATLDALHGARGEKVLDWNAMTTERIEPLLWTGASLHYMDNGIDSGEVIFDALDTEINPQDTILELRWNNFNNSLFPALHEGLLLMAQNSRRVKESANEAV